MACGVPMIAAMTGVTADIIRASGAGATVSCGEVAGLIREIAKVLDSELLRRAIQRSRAALCRDALRRPAPSPGLRKGPRRGRQAAGQDRSGRIPEGSWSAADVTDKRSRSKPERLGRGPNHNGWDCPSRNAPEVVPNLSRAGVSGGRPVSISRDGNNAMSTVAQHHLISRLARSSRRAPGPRSPLQSRPELQPADRGRHRAVPGSDGASAVLELGAAAALPFSEF